MSKIDKVIFGGKTHTTARGGERVDIALSSPNEGSTSYTYLEVDSHPLAEQLFAGAWSACFMSALKHVAKEKQVQLPAGVSLDLEVDVGLAGDGFLLQARLDVSLPGMPREVAESLAHTADQVCPYSKATRGNIGVTMRVFTS
ncbi:MAG: Ohr family peroxiredoxin [Burkholderiaceae bacterium]|nr:Ohr family peroxiredoxin [Burkholderiaceae bacterium]